MQGKLQCSFPLVRRRLGWAVVQSEAPCASRRGTRHEHDSTHGEEHAPAMPIAHNAHARDGTRMGVRGGLRSSGRRRRIVVGEARGVF